MEKKEPENTEGTINRLIDETRQLHALLDELRRELFMYKDLSKLSMRGAIAYLIRHKRALDEIKLLLKRASHKPGDAMQILLDIEALIKKMD